MKNMRLIEEKTPFPVNKFEEKTNKEYPYYQSGNKYGLCPACGSSVQIIGGNNNRTYSRNDNGESMHAAHTQNGVKDLPFDAQAKLNCHYYKGNRNNWQRIYERKSDTEENQYVERYIEENKSEIAQKIGNIIGLKCVYRNGESKLFKDMYESFKANGGLRIPSNQFVPEYLPRLIIERANPVKCWGSIFNDVKMKGSIQKKQEFKDAFEGKQFIPEKSHNVELVGTLNDDQNPTKLVVKLIYDNGKNLIVKKVPAKVRLWASN